VAGLLYCDGGGGEAGGGGTHWANSGSPNHGKLIVGKMQLLESILKNHLFKE